MKQRIIKDAKFKHAWVTREQGIELENLIAGGGSEVGKELVEQIDQLDKELQDHKTEFTNFYEGEFKTLQKDESELGNQVQAIQGELNVLVRKDTPTIKDLCSQECAWAGDLQSQITSIGQELDRINKKIGNGREEGSDLLFSTTKEISITMQDQTLSGSMYIYDFEYNIEAWDDNTYNLEAVIFKNIHKDGVNYSGEVDKDLRKKTFINLSFDETTLYGSVQTPKMLNTTEGQYKLEVTCLWKKVLS